MSGELRQNENGNWVIKDICHDVNGIEVPAKYSYGGIETAFTITTTPRQITTPWYTEPGTKLIVSSIVRKYEDVSVQDSSGNWIIYKAKDNFRQADVKPLPVITEITIDNLTWVTDIPAGGGTAQKTNCTYVVTARYNNGDAEDITSEATVTGSKTVAASTIEYRHTAGILNLTATYGSFSTTKGVTIYQEKFVPVLEASCSQTNPGSQRTTATLTITSNISWGISTNVNWLTITPEPLTGSGNASKTVTYLENQSASQRSGVITVTGGSFNPIEIQVKQAGREIVVTGITLDNLTWVTDVPAEGGTANKNNCSYTVTAHKNDGTSSDVTSQATVTGSKSIDASSITSRHTAGTLTLTATYGGFSDTASVDIYQAAAGQKLTPVVKSFDIAFESDPIPYGIPFEILADNDYGSWTLKLRNDTYGEEPTEYDKTFTASRVSVTSPYTSYKGVIADGAFYDGKDFKIYLVNNGSFAGNGSWSAIYSNTKPTDADWLNTDTHWYWYYSSGGTVLFPTNQNGGSKTTSDKVLYIRVGQSIF